VTAVAIELPPIHAPFVQNAKHEITKHGFHKHDLRQEFQPDKDLVTVVNVVKYIKTDSKRHLIYRKSV
jgi:hypothetical protein